MSAAAREQIAERFREAGVDVTARFIDVADGEKGTHDHSKKGPDAVGGNYGIYATAQDRVVILDIDDYDGEANLAPLSRLPPTLEQRSPHGGTHRIYTVAITDDGRLPSAVLADHFGSQNLTPSWGEVRAANQYVVGAGSQLDGCDKDWCDRCADPDGGYYAIESDRPIAEVDADTLVDVLAADPSLAPTSGDGTAVDEASDGDAEPPQVDADTDDLLEYARACDDKLDRLWRGDYSDYRDPDAGGGVDRSKAESALAMKLGFWFQGDKQTVRTLLDRAETKKWAERTDDAYRTSILAAVDEVSEYYDPSDHGVRDPSEFDPAEVERGLAILQSATQPEQPGGQLEFKNGCYGYSWVRYDDDGNVEAQGFNSITNFTLETLSYIQTYEGELFHLRVHPQSPLEDAYEVKVHPTVFNEGRSFREQVVRGRTTWFNPGAVSKVGQQEMLNDLRVTVGSQEAPHLTGTEYIGLHGDDRDEWVSPAGVLTADGWSDDPDYVHFEKGGDQDSESSLADKWALDPADGAEYDAEAVASICELVPRTRLPERGLPILGWFYAAPLKPYIFGWEGEFNLLQVTGDSGAGKTSTLEMFYELFGASPAPFGCGDTGFTIEKKLGGSCGLPIWLDEYKPSDLAQGKLQWLHRRLREVTRGKTLPKGQSHLGEVTFRLRAPVVFSGEQSVAESAVRRRTVLTHLSEGGTTGDEERRFCRLTGASYTDADGASHQPEGYDLHEHAYAYYRWILERDEAELREWWQAARERVGDFAGTRIGNLDSAEVRGLQTALFGIRVFREFATAMGAAEEALPADAEVRAAVDHVIENIGPEGQRREHIDEFLELVSQAAAEDYIEHGVHYRIVESRKWEREVLALHMPTVFSAVKRYVQDYNLEGDYTVLGKSDYVDSLSDKANEDGTYALAVNSRVKDLANGSKAAYVDPAIARQRLGDDFTEAAFGLAEDDDEEGEPSATPVSKLTPGYATVTVTVKQVQAADEGAPMAGTATVADRSGTVDVIDWRGSDVLDELEAGECYRLTDVSVGYDQDGALQLELVENVTEATAIQHGVGFTESAEAGENDQLDSPATADGGQPEFEGLRGQIMAEVRDNGAPLSASELAGRLGAAPPTVEERLASLTQRGELMETPDGYDLP